MSATGQSRPRLPAFAPTDVRYASISDQSFAASRLVATGRVEMWRGGCRLNRSVAASFDWRCLSGSTMAPLPHPAHRTGQQISRIRLSDKTSRLAFARNANNGLKTAARRSQCSVADGIQVDHNHQLAGSLFRPRSTKVGRHSGFSASSSRRFGRRRNRVAMAISLSIRASWAPRQK